MAEARASLTSSAAEAPRADGPGYAEDADEDPASRAIRAAAEAAGTTGEGTASGTAAKVHVNRKMYKEFTELRLVQTLHAHEDAVWTMKFSHAGEYRHRGTGSDRSGVGVGSGTGGCGAGVWFVARGIFDLRVKISSARSRTGSTRAIAGTCWICAGRTRTGC